MHPYFLWKPSDLQRKSENRIHSVFTQMAQSLRTRCSALFTTLYAGLIPTLTLLPNSVKQADFMPHLPREQQSCTGYLDHPFKKQALREGERCLSPACKHRRVGVPSKVVTSISCSNNNTLTGWSSFCYGLCFFLAPTVGGWLRACALLTLCSLDQTGS